MLRYVVSTEPGIVSHRCCYEAALIDRHGDKGVMHSELQGRVIAEFFTTEMAQEVADLLNEGD